MFAIQRARWAVLLAALLLGLGCSSTPTPEPTAEADLPREPVAETPAAGDVTLSLDRSLDPVYFDTDQATLRPDARRALDAHARAILAHPEWGVVTVDGHCDERGSDGYNQQLGSRRAAAVERYLVSQGVPRDRIETRSFGSRRPAVDGAGESAWRMNRRSELQLETLAASL
jgi:peptidoglycan-associated lipoprotein